MILLSFTEWIQMYNSGYFITRNYVMFGSGQAETYDCIYFGGVRGYGVEFHYFVCFYLYNNASLVSTW